MINIKFTIDDEVAEKLSEILNKGVEKIVKEEIRLNNLQLSPSLIKDGVTTDDFEYTEEDTGKMFCQILDLLGIENPY